MKTLISALIAIVTLAGAAQASTIATEGCGYGHFKITKDSTVAASCGYGH